MKTMKINLVVVVAFYCCFVFTEAKGPIQISSVLREAPSSNTHVVYDDTQVLVVDVGKEESDAQPTIDLVTKLIGGADQQQQRTLNAFFVTHAHPDHCMALWKMQQAFPSVKAYVASQEIKNEMVNVMSFFARFLNQSSPGNPLAKSAPFLYNYTASVQVLPPSDNDSIPLLWQSSSSSNDIELLSDFTLTGETYHYAMLQVPSLRALITGDILYVRSHLFMGWDVSLISQCDWIAQLHLLSAALASDTQLYPGHGSIGLPSSTTVQDIIQENIGYIKYARSVYVSACDVDNAVDMITKAYPAWAGPVLLSAFSAPFRVPGDAVALGCDCSTNKSCAIAPPLCSYDQQQQ